jgi:hypothetical protein
MTEIPLQGLGHRARLLQGKQVTIENLRLLCQRDIWILPGFGRNTSNEIKAWPARLGVDLPDRRPASSGGRLALTVDELEAC